MDDRDQLVTSIKGYGEVLSYPTGEYLMEDLSKFLGRRVGDFDDLSDNEILQVYDRMSTAAALAPDKRNIA